MGAILNDKQQEAARHIAGPLLIVAGAGAGKTKTITERVVRIVESGTAPERVLAITFTNKAAKEMRERIVHRLKEEGLLHSFARRDELPTIKTFHSLGVEILSTWHTKLSLPKQVTILDQSDSLSIVKEIILSLGLDPKLHDPSKIRNIISKEKGDFVTASSYEKKVASSSMDIIAKVWKRYEEALSSQKAVDFDDLIIKTVLLLERDEAVRAHYHNRFLYVHVDEYQDTNEAQYMLTKLLVNPTTNNICVVGDTDQNIYSWRGANLKNLMNFERDFPGTHTVLLEENYRSTGAILNLANRTIKKNNVRKEKNLFTKKGTGEFVTIQPCFDEHSEASWVAKTIKERRAANEKESVAVLYRANFQSRILEEALLSANVPYTLLGVHFFDRREVKDVLSYLRAAHNRDSLTDLKRVFETPKKGLGKVTLLKIFAGEQLPKSAELKVHDVYTFLDRIVAELKESPLSHVIQMIIVDSGLEKELLSGGADEAERLENIRELVSLSTKYDEMKGEEALPLFLEEASLQSDQDDDKSEDRSGVRLMTVHASKGLEFDTVFIVGLEHDLFPHTKLSARNRTKEEEEEERRLFYVAVTRAREKLFLTYAEIRTIFGQKEIHAPSIFLSDVDPDETDWHDVHYQEKRPFTVYI